MLKAVLFDMDGVIVNTEPLHRRAYEQMFEEYNLKVSASLYASFTGMSTLSICKRLCEVFSLDLQPNQLAVSKRNYFKKLFENGHDIQLIDGVLDLIQHYNKNDLSLVLASSASMSNIEMIFEKFDLNPYFKAKISGADLKESKPNPEIFEKATRLSGHSSKHCMVIEDATNGIQAARAAGLFCVAYEDENSPLQDFSNANLVVSSFKELELEKIQNYFME